MAYVYAGLGDLDRSFEWLEVAYEERIGMLIQLSRLPAGRDLAHDPRFSELMRRIGLE